MRCVRWPNGPCHVMAWCVAVRCSVRCAAGCGVVCGGVVQCVVCGCPMGHVVLWHGVVCMVWWGVVWHAAAQRIVSHHGVTIPAVTPTFSSTSHPATSPEVPRDTSSGHVPLGSHVIHPRAPPSRPMPRDPISRPRWVRLRESPPSTPNAPDEPGSSTDPQIDSAAMTEDLSILQGLLSELPMSLWSAVPDKTDTDGH